MDEIKIVVFVFGCTSVLSVVDVYHQSVDLIHSFLQTGMAQKWEASSMSSADGETIPFVGPTPLEGPVEAWLCDIEKNMRLTLKEQLKNTRQNLKRMLNKRDKWIKEHFGQMCITASQIQWTADVTKALGLTKDRGDQRAIKSLKKKQVIAHFVVFEVVSKLKVIY